MLALCSRKGGEEKEEKKGRTAKALIKKLMPSKLKGPPLNLDPSAFHVESSYKFLDGGQTLAFRTFLFENGRLQGSPVGTGDKPLELQDIDDSQRKIVGKGSSGVVEFVTHKKTGQPLALKSIAIEMKLQRDEVEAELKVLMTQMESEHIMKNLGAFWIPEKNTICLVMEWMSYSLHDITACMLDESLVQNIAFQLVRGLQYLHEKKKVLHRDIKPRNVLINPEGVVKIGDFGIAKVVGTYGSYKITTYKGTELYMAPERLEEGEYSFPSDIWSFGLTLVAMALGTNPWGAHAAETAFSLVGKIQEGLVPTFPKTFSPEAHQFLARCLCRDPSRRAKSGDLLADPWLTKCKEETSRSELSQFLLLFTRLASDAAAQAQKVEKDPSEEKKTMYSSLDNAIGSSSSF